MGEESITLPPASNRVRSTSLRGARSGPAGATSKVCQVPTPTIGSGSLVLGMGRVSMVGLACARVPGSAAQAPAANANCKRSLRVAAIGYLAALRVAYQFVPSRPPPGVTWPLKRSKLRPDSASSKVTSMPSMRPLRMGRQRPSTSAVPLKC